MPLSIVLECLSLGNDADGLPASLHACTGGAPPTMTVIDTVQRFVVARCAERPLLLVLDDLQWADDMSLLVWHALHKLTTRLPLLLVSAARPVPAGYEVRLLRRVLPRDGTTVVDLGPLDDDTATGLVRAWSRPPGPDPGTVRSFVAAAAGNPYYLRHLVLADRDGRTADTPGPELTDAVSGTCNHSPTTPASCCGRSRSSATTTWWPTWPRSPASRRRNSYPRWRRRWPPESSSRTDAACGSGIRSSAASCAARSPPRCGC
ncbi:AAA family ATPase [Micromonospora sp. BRA006-A]|nr:AAA family ATPase [Micromonospora sp. BRA006-A]